MDNLYFAKKFIQLFPEHEQEYNGLRKNFETRDISDEKTHNH